MTPVLPATVSAEQAYIDLYGAALALLGHALAPPGAPGTSAANVVEGIS